MKSYSRKLVDCAEYHHTYIGRIYGTWNTNCHDTPEVLMKPHYPGCRGTYIQAAADLDNVAHGISEIEITQNRIRECRRIAPFLNHMYIDIDLYITVDSA